MCDYLWTEIYSYFLLLGFFQMWLYTRQCRQLWHHTIHGRGSERTHSRGENASGDTQGRYIVNSNVKLYVIAVLPLSYALYLS